MKSNTLIASKGSALILLSIFSLILVLSCKEKNPVNSEDESSSSTDLSSSLDEGLSSTLDSNSSIVSNISSSREGDTTNVSSSSLGTSSVTNTSSITDTSSSATNLSSSTDSLSSHQNLSSHTDTLSSGQNTSSTADTLSSQQLSSSVNSSSSSNDTLSSSITTSSSSSLVESSSSEVTNTFDPENPLKEFFDRDTFPGSITELSLFQDNVIGNAYLEKVLPYDVNTELWSDFLYKKRHFYVPDGQSMSLSSGSLSYPDGVVFIKDFYLREVLSENAAHPDSGLRILETRFLFKKNSSWQFITYKWNEDETNAHPLPRGEVVDPISYWDNQNSGLHQMKHTFPSQNQCTQCHLSDNEVLGFIPAQIHKENQLQDFIAQNKIQGSVNNIHTWASIFDITEGIQHRSRSYLAANCAHCHSPNGMNKGATFSIVDFTYTSIDQPLNYDSLQSDIPGEDYSRVLFTKRPERSSLIYRMNERTVEADQMPPLGTHKKDIDAIDIITQWIDSLPDNWDSTGNNDTIPWEPNSVSIERAFDNVSISNILSMYQIPGSDDFLAISQRSGEVHLITQNGSWTSQVIHDVGDVQSGNEEGLLGMTFHPDHAQNGLYYLNYQPTSLGGDVRLEERRLDGSNQDDGYSRVIMETVLQSTAPNHNGGAVHFGRDGYLYVSYGDGGGWNGGQSAQGIDYLSGTIIRIDVDNPDSGKEYGIPADNPFVGSNRMDEVFAYGLRNPWRFSFSKINGDMFIGDVGHRSPSREEVDHIAYDGNYLQGYNFGWPCREGDREMDANAANCDNRTDPIYAYDQSGGGVIGGHVLNRPGNPYHGAYIFAEYGNDARIMALMKQGSSWEYQRVADAPGFRVFDITTNSFGNEIYLLYSNGQIHRLQWEALE